MPGPADRADRLDRTDQLEAPRQTSREALLERQSRLPPGHPSAPRYAAADATRSGEGHADSWRAAVPRLRAAWERHLARWPRDTTTSAEHTGQQRDTATGLDAAADRRLASACDKVVHAEPKITATMRGIEAQDGDRHLAGLSHCLKGRERITEKAVEYLREMPSFSHDEAVALVPDSVRYTFEYRDGQYAEGARTDIGRLQAAGFELIKVRNYWTDVEYKGINSQWREPATGQRFEVQFHTAVSMEAKELTHGAYERLRTGSITDEEEFELEAFQRGVTALVPVPPSAADIPEYPRPGAN